MLNSKAKTAVTASSAKMSKNFEKEGRYGIEINCSWSDVFVVVRIQSDEESSQAEVLFPV